MSSYDRLMVAEKAEQRLQERAKKDDTKKSSDPDIQFCTFTQAFHQLNEEDPGKLIASKQV